MKKTITFITAILFCNVIFSQTEKGSKIIGVSFGSLSFSNSNSKTSYSNTPTVYNSDGSSFSISVYPSVSWFIQKNLAVGAGISVGFYNSKSKSSNTGSTTVSDYTSTQPSFYLSPTARYYFSGSTKGMPFAQVNLQYGIYGGNSKSVSSTGSSSTTTTKSKGDWNAGLSFGYEQFVTKNIGFYGSLGVNYGNSKTEYDYKPSTGTGYIYTSEYSRLYIPVNVGLQIHLAAKSKK